jgi:hypothetical protein
MKKATPHESALIFDWKRRERTAPWLLSFLLITLFGIASLFVLFRIVTPGAPKLTARPQQMIVLNPDVPAERALIHLAMDRSFTLLPSETPGIHDVPAAARLPGFKTTAFEMKLKAANSTLTARERPGLLDQNFLDALPPLPPTKPTELKPAPQATLQARIEGPAKRALISDGVLRDISLVDPGKARFRVAIGRLGQVLLAVPLSASEDPAVMVQLHAAMTQLHFQPDSAQQQEMDWAEIGFAWVKEVTP